FRSCGLVCPPSVTQTPVPIRLISTNSTAARLRRQELSMSIFGTALSTRRGGSRHKDRIIWDRLADYVRAMASILRSSALVSLPFTLSEKSSAALAVKEIPVALPVPAEPEHRGSKGKPGGSVRPTAGPVVPLTGANAGSEQVLLGGPGESPGATVGLSASEAVAAPSARADNFSWPRGVVNVEPAAVEPAAPDTTAPDAGAKSAMAAQRKSAMDAYAAQTG